ncbi:MAG TPA: plastocyanin/azurin family copper-binding protein [Candidatus Limnocylindrales bacterium]|nr:plastocyanin/azurin family copper-binding protein [Candidatus Limnocylindrales bacterium]
MRDSAATVRPSSRPCHGSPSPLLRGEGGERGPFTRLGITALTRLSLGLGLLLVIYLAASAAESPGTNRFFLPQNPVAAAYVLGRLSNQELIAAPRSEFVYVALLQRKGLDRKYRLEALEGLAKVRQTDALTELLRGLVELDKKGEPSTDTLQDLGQLLLRFKPEELKGKRTDLNDIVAQSQLSVTRQIGLAALVSADQSFEPCWKETATNPSRLVDLLFAVPLVQRAELRQGVYGRTEELVRTADSPEIKRAAMTALVAIPGHDLDNFNALAKEVQSGTQKEDAVAGLMRIPQKTWPKELVPVLETNLLSYLQSIPTTERTGGAFANAMQLATDAAAMLPEPEARALTGILRGLGPAVFVLHAVYEQMRFDKQLLVVEVGKPVGITLQNDDAMPHNLAILKPGSLEEIGQAAEKMQAEPDAEGRLYVPSSPKVLYATRLVPPAQKVQLTFTAPTEPGEYPFVCTFPGHWRRMVGTLAIVPDVEAYLAAHATAAQPKITEWKLADLAPDLGEIGPSRDLLTGKELFSKLACIQCHKLGEQGYPYGPNLSDVFIRYKKDRANVLEQILEPSKLIEERYRNVSFELKGDEPVTGMLLKEDAETFTVQTGPADSLVQVLKKSDVLKRTPQASSPMPVGLLNTLSKQQILDLLAYVESGGAIASHDHQH